MESNSTAELRLFARLKIRWIVYFSRLYLEEFSMEENTVDSSGSPIVPGRVISLGNVNVYNIPL